jgi:hypothetical protein
VTRTAQSTVKFLMDGPQKDGKSSETGGKIHI